MRRSPDDCLGVAAAENSNRRRQRREPEGAAWAAVSEMTASMHQRTLSPESTQRVRDLFLIERDYSVDELAELWNIPAADVLGDALSDETHV